MKDARQVHEEGSFLRVREAVGPPRGTLVFVHGLGESGLCFEHLLPEPGLAPWRLLVPDLPGYGRSPRRPAPPSLPEQADRLARWLKGREDPRPLTLVGHSMGGVLGILLAERHPGLLQALVDVDGNLSPGDCVFSGRAARHDLPVFLEGGFDRLLEAVWRQGRRDRAQRGYYVSMRLCDPRLFHRNSLELVEVSAREDLARRLAALPLRHLYVAGVPGGACPRSRQLLDEAGAAWTAVEESGHWPFLDHPARFVEILRGFLD